MTSNSVKRNCTLSLSLMCTVQPIHYRLLVDSLASGIRGRFANETEYTNGKKGDAYQGKSVS
jgi:hypothetical protein